MLVIVVVLAFGVVLIINQTKSPEISVSSFAECEKAGYPIAESYPRQCQAPNGRSFTEDASTLSQPISIIGEVICLPKRGQGEQTSECAIGLKGSDDLYYGLSNLSEVDPSNIFSAGNIRVEVVGAISPRTLTGPDGNVYDTVGVIAISTIKKVTEGNFEEVNTFDAPTLQRKNAIETEYPEFKDFEKQTSFAGQTVTAVSEGNDNYFAYLEAGSGVPIAKATCFRVDRMLKVYKVGEFPDMLDSYSGYRDINPINCAGVK